MGCNSHKFIPNKTCSSLRCHKILLSQPTDSSQMLSKIFKCCHPYYKDNNLYQIRKKWNNTQIAIVMAHGPEWGYLAPKCSCVLPGVVASHPPVADCKPFEQLYYLFKICLLRLSPHKDPRQLTNVRNRIQGATRSALLLLEGVPFTQATEQCSLQLLRMKQSLFSQKGCIIPQV